MHMHLLHVGTHAHATAPYTFDNCTRSGSPHNVLHSSSNSSWTLPAQPCFVPIPFQIGLGYLCNNNNTFSSYLSCGHWAETALEAFNPEDTIIVLNKTDLISHKQIGRGLDKCVQVNQTSLLVETWRGKILLKGAILRHIALPFG